MRTLIAALALALSILPAAAYDTPHALIDALYAPYMPGGTAVAEPETMRSEELQKLYTDEEARQTAGDGGSFDFDPLIDAQDSEITDFAVKLTDDSNEYAATADVTFKNFGEPITLQLTMFNFEDGWKLEDVVSTTPGTEYQLTDLLSPKIVIADDVFADPKKVVEALYMPYAPDFNWRRWDESQLQSEGLKALYDKDAKESEASGEMGRLDFDPYVNGQDYEVKDLVISDAEISGDKATVPVDFKNYDTPQSMFVTLVKEADGRWKVDDVENFDPEFPYRLRAILEAPLP